MNIEEAFIEKGNAYFLNNNLHEAIKIYKKVLKINPKQVVALNNTASAYEMLGKREKAILYLKKAIKLEPKFTNSLKNLAFIYLKDRKFKKALSLFEKIIKINPKEVEAIRGKIITLRNMGCGKNKLLDTFKLVKKNKIYDFDLLFNLGNLAAWLSLPDYAASFYEKALKIKPIDVATLSSLSLVYTLIQDRGKKLRTLKKILDVSQDPYWQVWSLNQIALVYLQKQQYKKTIYYLKKCLKIDPAFTRIYTNIYHTYRHACNWKNAEKIEKKKEFIENEDPMISIIRNDNPQKNLDTAQRFIREIISRTPIIKFNYPKHDEKIRIGYLSSDFRNHPVGHMVASLFGFHNRRKFKIFLYSCGIDDKSYWRKRIEKEADIFRNVNLLSHQETAQIINNDNIDILIDLTGLTLGSRIETLVHKPAPIQVNWLGYPGTTGAYFVDYILADKIIIPPEQQRYYVEKVIYLPNCYQVNDYQQKISNKKFTRKDFDLPEKAVVFSSFNQSFKIDPPTFHLWMDILKSVPGSVLWLMDQGLEFQKNLCQEAEKQGVSPKRLTFSKYIENDKHLKRLSLSDIYLDPLIYGGHKTTTDYLMATVPPITRIGNHFASRVSSSILYSFGLPELVTKNTEEYKNLSIKLATNKEKRYKLRQKIKKLKKNNPLFNTKLFVEYLEKAYIKMWQLYKENKPTESFEVL